MIFDDIKNLEKYNVVSKKVSDFITNLSSDIETGRYIIDENAYANVDTYETKPIEKCALEAHKKYIDIQLLLVGNEELDYCLIDGLSVKEKYDEKRDLMFYQIPDKPLNSVQLEPSKFVLIYPYEAHMPQMQYNHKVSSVKKVVVKIKLD